MHGTTVIFKMQSRSAILASPGYLSANYSLMDHIFLLVSTYDSCHAVFIVTTYNLACPD